MQIDRPVVVFIYEGSSQVELTWQKLSAKFECVFCVNLNEFKTSHFKKNLSVNCR